MGKRVDVIWTTFYLRIVKTNVYKVWHCKRNSRIFNTRVSISIYIINFFADDVALGIIWTLNSNSKKQHATLVFRHILNVKILSKYSSFRVHDYKVWVCIAFPECVKTVSDSSQNPRSNHMSTNIEPFCQFIVRQTYKFSNV